MWNIRVLSHTQRIVSTYDRHTILLTLTATLQAQYFYGIFKGGCFYFVEEVGTSMLEMRASKWYLLSS